MLTEEQIYKITAKLDKDYQLISHHFLNEDEQILLEDSTPNKCRFCGRTSPEVTFNKEAHAISHMLGNNWLKSTYECDECNALFAMAESQYSQCMGVYHTLMQCKGKRGIPAYQYPEGLIKISGDGKIHITVKDNSDGKTLPYQIDESNKTVRFEISRTYIPSMVWKALTKMALSIMPEKHLGDFEEALRWLQADIKTPGKYKLMKYPVYFKAYPENFPFITTFIFKKKENSPNPVPNYIFILTYGGIMLQVPLTGCSLDDTLQGKECDLTIMPNPLDEKCSPFKEEILELWNNEKIAKEPIPVAFKFSDFEESIP